MTSHLATFYAIHVLKLNMMIVINNYKKAVTYIKSRF